MTVNHLTSHQAAEFESNTLPAHARTTLETLLSRRSHWPLIDPGPTDEEINVICDIGLRAPDNGLLRPWRFVIVRGAAREELGDLLVDLSCERDPDRPRPEHEQRKQRAFAAPLLIALGASLARSSSIPQVEQLLSVGAAAMNMLNAIHALGYGGYWTSGPDCDEPALHDALGFEDIDRLLGFLYVGTPRNATPAPERPLRSNYVREWGISAD